MFSQVWSSTGLYSRPSPLYHLYKRYFNVSELLFAVLYADDHCVLLGGKYLENLIICLIKQCVEKILPLAQIQQINIEC